MKKNISKENGLLNIDIVIDGKDWTDEVAKAKKQLIKTTTVKGFRKGQAPEELALKAIEPFSIYKRALDNKLDDVYKDAAMDLTKENIISKPEISYTKASETEGGIRISSVLFPDVKLPNLKDIKTKRDSVNVTKDDVSSEVENFKKQLRNTTSVTDKETKAKMNDILTIDFVGKIDGESFSGGTANDHDLELGSKSFIDNFEEQLVGAKIGDEIDVNVTFPADYQVEEFKSKKAIFEVVVKEIKTQTELVGKELKERLEMFGFESMEQLEKEAKTLIEKDLIKKANEKFRGQVIQEIIDLDGTDIPVPDHLVQQESKGMWENLEKEVEKNKQNMKDVLKEIKKTKEEYILHHIKPEAVRRLQDSLIISEVSKIAGIKIEDKELDSLIIQQAEDAKIPVEQFKEIVNPETVRINAIHDKTLDYLANITK